MKSKEVILNEIEATKYREKQYEKALAENLAEGKDVDGHKLLGRSLACETSARKTLEWVLKS